MTDQMDHTGGDDPDTEAATTELALLLDDAMTHLRQEDTTPRRLAEALIAKGVRAGHGGTPE